MANIKIGIVNHSSVPDDEMEAITEAVQAQVREDFLPIYGVDADIHFFPGGIPLDLPNTISVAILESPEQGGDLGYHQKTPSGQPLAKVFLSKSSLLSVTLSHEILELLADPGANLVALVDMGGGRMRGYAYEICDPVESDEFNYARRGRPVSDFVTPAWFNPTLEKGSTKFSFQGNVSGPLEIAEGGYISYLDFGAQAASWQQISARKEPKKILSGSRTDMRHNRPAEWKRSGHKEART